MYSPKDKTENKEEVQRKRSFLKKEYLIGLITIFVLIVLGITFLNLKSNTDGRGLFGNEGTPTPVCVCTSNQYNCGDFKSSNIAQECFDYCYPDYGDVHYLDVDEDLIACEPKR